MVTASGSAWDYVTVADLDRAHLRVAISPMPTLVTVLRDALQQGRRGIPGDWRGAVISRLRRRDLAVLAPFADPAVSSYPSLLEAVDPHASRETVANALERLRAADGGTLVHALDHARDVSPAPAWDRVKRAPDRWLIGYVDALHHCWPAVKPLWQRSIALLEREEDRLHAAMERGVAPTQALAGISPRASVAGDALRIAPGDGESRRLRVDRRGATVIPMIVSGRAGTLSAPDEYAEWIGYPLPDSWRAFDDDAPPRASLEALLGGQRAALLRALEQPQTAGRLARLLACTPSVITHHLRALEAAGLVHRHPQGRHIVVQRSSRGRELLALYHW